MGVLDFLPAVLAVDEVVDHAAGERSGTVQRQQGDEVIDDGTLVIAGNRIQSLGPRDTTPVPEGFKVIDAKGMTAIPGLIDVHDHGSQAEFGITPERNWQHDATLAFGVTTIHDPSNHSQSIFAARELIQAGLMTGPRTFSTGTILYGAEGAFRSRVNSLEDARQHLSRMQAMGAFSVKSYNQPRRNQRQQVLQAARELGMMVVPEGGALFQHNMSMIVDGHTGIEHAIPIANAYDDVLQLWAKSEVGYTPTLNVAYGGLGAEHYWYQDSEVYAHPRLRRFVPSRVLDARGRRPATAPHHEWNHIDVAKFATATYTAKGFTKTADNKYVANGTLALRGVTKPVTFTFEWKPGANPVLTGKATVKRLDFGVGQGDWNDTKTIPDDTAISTVVKLQAK